MAFDLSTHNQVSWGTWLWLTLKLSTIAIITDKPQSIFNGWDSVTHSHFPHSPPNYQTKPNLKDYSHKSQKENFIGRESKVRHLEAVVQELPSNARQKFFRLHDCKRKKGKDHIKWVATPSFHLLLPGCEKSCEGIFRTNNFCLGKLGEAELHGVFSTLSR